ncbi:MULTISPECIES: NfeD family protein [Chelativorans]|jgi:membrane protein implicated in regulation of membrane protease activity|uniref:NfeD-like C-terminal domain-containing protein n=1 Tax=Chelativorans sp. (strain BNC1) TaxID=266779 RepID=Q11ER2_CHESB|nr:MULTISPECIES: NfeD family protein [Chelativorans]
MLMSFLTDLGPWNWMLLGFILLVLEIILPGVFLLWIGIAAVLTGALSLQLWDVSFWTWQVQVLVFLALSLVSAFIGKRVTDARREEDTDEPLLNRRAEQLVGRTAALEEPISGGYGRIRLGDTTWRVTGPDLPAGTRVRVVSARGGDLHVEKE